MPRPRPLPRPTDWRKMNLSEKSKDHDLMSCNNVNCQVLTFIRSIECPVCNEPGGFIRGPRDGRGTPGWMGRVAEDG
jgi:hypothetical protein